MHPNDQKEHLRQSVKERILQMNEKERAAEGRSLSRRLIELLPPEPVAIAAYVPMKTEVDITLFLNHLLENHYSLFLPRAEGGKLVFRRAESLEGLKVGMFGVPEVPETAPLLETKDLAIAIVPARAYDRKGARLGRGNGGYDIWIRKQRAENPRTQFWGVIFECQLLKDVPMEEHDERVDKIITARGLAE